MLAHSVFVDSKPRPTAEPTEECVIRFHMLLALVVFVVVVIRRYFFLFQIYRNASRIDTKQM